jgi:hypothetical protein
MPEVSRTTVPRANSPTHRSSEPVCLGDTVATKRVPSGESCRSLVWSARSMAWDADPDRSSHTSSRAVVVAPSPSANTRSPREEAEA